MKPDEVPDTDKAKPEIVPLTIEQKRTQALENLLVFYLTERGDFGAKEYRGPVSMNNRFRIEFDKPPIQSEIEHLIIILKAHQPILPENRDDKTVVEMVNDSLAAADMHPVARREIPMTK